MQQHNYQHHYRAMRLRRTLGASGIILSLLMIIGVSFYAYDMRATILRSFGQAPNPQRSNVVGQVKPANTCKAPPHTPGSSIQTINSGGLQRTFSVHLPPSYGQQLQPLVINYHAYSFTIQKMATYTNMAAEADKAGFILIFPQGVDTPPSWNAGLGALGPTGSTDDVQFTSALLKHLETNYCVDSHRIYLAGFSLGGGMAYRLACRLSMQIAAIATVAGAYYHAPGGCQPARPVPVLEIHGQADSYAPYNGNLPAGMAAVQTYLNVWLDRDHCSSANQIIFQQGDVTGREWSHCAGGSVVEHYSVSDGNHTWPGAGPDRGLGFTTHVIDANVVLWNFFKHFTT